MNKIEKFFNEHKVKILLVIMIFFHPNFVCRKKWPNISL